MNMKKNIDIAIKLCEESQYQKAFRMAKKLLKHDKTNSYILRVLTTATEKLGYKKDQKKYLLQLIKLVEDPIVYQNLALLYKEENNLEKSKLFFNKALDLNPNYVDCYNALSMIYSLEYNFEKAEEMVMKSIALTEGTGRIFESYHFLANMYKNAGEYEKALNIYIELIRLNYDSDQMKFNFSLVALKLHRYVDGFNFYRYRYSPHVKGAISLVNDIPMLDKGINIDGKNILLKGEQGYGDMIFFIRYIPLLLKENVKVTVVVDALVIKLFQVSFPNVEVVNQTFFEEYDYYLMMGDLGYYFDTEYDTIPYQEGYLRINKNDASSLYERYFKHEGKRKIGIVWRSTSVESENETEAKAKERELYNLALEDFLKYFNTEDVQLYSLQLEITKKERELLELNNIPSLGDEFISFYDNALAIYNLDTIIGIATSTILVSGAMGKESVIMLPKSSPWIWGDSSMERSNWFKNIYITRQKKRDSWVDVFEDTSQYLKEIKE
ncbi:tetratricopeptide repeat protein [Sulfurimonas sp.]|nr:tetratricopeptide repeat protein [Sulfurimonas sp.]